MHIFMFSTAEHVWKKTSAKESKTLVMLLILTLRGVIIRFVEVVCS